MTADPTLDTLRRHYQELIDGADPLAAAVAQQQLDKLNAPQGTRSDSESPYPPSRWVHVPLATLFTEHGNETKERNNGTVVCGHEPIHRSSSGACVVIWPDTGRYFCSSCHVSGDAATYLQEITKDSYRTVAGTLRARFGAPKLQLVESGDGDDDTTPQVIIDVSDEDGEDLVPQVNMALVRRNKPHLFTFGSLPMRVEGDEETPYSLQQLTAARLKFEMGQAAEFQKTGKKKDGTLSTRTVFPPDALVSMTLNQGLLSFLPPIKQLIRRPFLTEAGELITTPGYNAESRLYYQPQRNVNLAPVTGSDADVARALSLWRDDVLVDFLFQQESDRAHALSLALLPYVRNLIHGPTPLYCVEAAQPRTGKSILTQNLLYPALGADLGTMPQTDDEEEWRKTITTTLLNGDEATCIDNVKRMLRSGVLANALTTPMWKSRILGGNTEARVPVSIIWTATGNNIMYSDEMYGRRVAIRIESNMANPELRTGFKHRQLNEWVKAHRDDLLWAGLTIACGWTNAGRRRSTATLGSYEEWAGVLGGILDFLGVPGFLADREDSSMALDPYVLAWQLFVAEWWERHGPGPKLTRELLPIAVGIDGLNLGKTDSETAMRHALGLALNKHRDAVIGEWRIRRAGIDSHAKAPIWQLVPLNPQPTAPKYETVDTETILAYAGEAKPGGAREISITSSRKVPVTNPESVLTSTPLLRGVAGGSPAYTGNGKNNVSTRQVIRNSTGDERQTPRNHPQPPAQLRERSISGVITSALELQTALLTILAAERIGFDIETTGLDPNTDSVRLVQIATDDAIYVADCTFVDLSTFAPLFGTNGPVVIGHNIKFDLSFFAKQGMELPPQRRCFDTMLASQMLHAGQPAPKGTHALGGVVERWLGIELDKSLQVSDWSGELTAEQIEYAQRDAAILLPLYDRLRSELDTAGLNVIADVEMRVVPLLAHMAVTGVGFDPIAWAALSDEAVMKAAQLSVELDALVTPEKVLWSSPKQVLAYLNGKGHRVANTDELTLRELAPYEPVAELLLKLREAQTNVSRYGMELIRKHCRLVEAIRQHRIFADYRQLGAEATGRMSGDNPNMQNIPRDKRYRACFAPEPGRVLIKVDYSQIELRIAAELARDARMLEAYRTGQDLHKLTAAAIYSMALEDVTPYQRQVAKSANFGLLYGAGPQTFMNYCRRNGITMALDEATLIRAKFFDTYPGLRQWHRTQGNAVDAPVEEDTSFAASWRGGSDREDGPLSTRTLLGRRRLNVWKFTEKLNTPVQGTGADMIKLALARVWEDRAAQPGAEVAIIVHDEICIEADALDAERVAAWLVAHMEAAGKELLKTVPVVAEATIAADWSGTPV